MSAIIKSIWAFLGPLLVNLAVEVGLPEALKYLAKTGLPSWVKNGIIGFLKGALEQVNQLQQVVMQTHAEVQQVKLDPSKSQSEKKEEVRAVKAKGKKKAKAICSGIGCEIELKK